MLSERFSTVCDTAASLSRISFIVIEAKASRDEAVCPAVSDGLFNITKRDISVYGSERGIAANITEPAIISASIWKVSLFSPAAARAALAEIMNESAAATQPRSQKAEQISPAAASSIVFTESAELQSVTETAVSAPITAPPAALRFFAAAGMAAQAHTLPMLKIPSWQEERVAIAAM